MTKYKSLDKLTGKDCVRLLYVHFKTPHGKKYIKSVYGTTNKKEIEKLIDKNGWRKYFKTPI